MTFPVAQSDVTPTNYRTQRACEIGNSLWADGEIGKHSEGDPLVL